MPEASASISTSDLTAGELDELASAVIDDVIFASWMVNGMDSEHMRNVFPLGAFRLSPTRLVFTKEQGEEIAHVYQYRKHRVSNIPSAYPRFDRCIGIKLKYVKPLTDAIARQKALREEEEQEERDREAGLRDD